MKNSSKNFRSGFTLIELLVVIAIIGVLASIVFAAVNDARGKGGDAGVKSNLAQIRTKAELLYDTYGCYINNNAVSTICTSVAPVNPAGKGLGTCPAVTATTASIFYQSDIVSLIAAAKKAGGGFTSCRSTSGVNATWAAAVQLSSDKTKAWCVDSATGYGKEVALSTNDQAGLNATINNVGVAFCI